MGLVVLPEDPDDEWDLGAWLEVMGQQRPGGAGGFSLAASEDVAVIQVPDNQVRSCLRQLLGWAWADDAAPWRLHREAVPVQNPRYPWLWCEAASVQPQHPLGGEPVFTTDVYDELGNLVSSAPTGTLKRAGEAFDTYGPDGYGRYGTSLVTVRFRPTQHRIWRDDDPTWADTYLGREWLRNFGLLGTTYAQELINADGGSDYQLYWAEGTVGGSGSGPVAPSAFTGCQYIRLCRNRFKMIWKNVPVNYLGGEVSFAPDDIASFLMPLPRRFVAAIGKVNSTPFPGANSPHLAGTLLLADVETVPYQQPVMTDSEFGLWACDVVMTFDHYNPDRDPGAVRNLGGSTLPAKYGHHLLPSRITNKSYYVTGGTDATRGTYAGKSTLEEYDFHDLFKHAEAP